MPIAILWSRLHWLLINDSYPDCGRLDEEYHTLNHPPCHSIRFHVIPVPSMTWQWLSSPIHVHLMLLIMVSRLTGREQKLQLNRILRISTDSVQPLHKVQNLCFQIPVHMGTAKVFWKLIWTRGSFIPNNGLLSISLLWVGRECHPAQTMSPDHVQIAGLKAFQISDQICK